MGGSVQRTRSFGFEKVKTTPGTLSDQPKTYTFRANDGEFDRYQDRLSVGGWQLSSFNANPVILYNHEAGDGGFLGLGRKDVLPIGKGRAYVDGNALYVDVQFDQKDAFARQVEQKVADGFLNAVSVRYAIPEGSYVENEKGGLDSTVQDLLEISIVTIPGNQRALRVKGFEGEAAELIEKIALRAAQIVVKALDDRDVRKKSQSEHTASIEAIAARALNLLESNGATK